MTAIDQDIRLTPEQIIYLQEAARRRVRELTKKIDTALDARRAGVAIQHGTLDSHMREREALLEARIALEDGRQRIVQHFKDKLRTTTQEGEQP